jgi:hypothetical protein
LALKLDDPSIKQALKLKHYDDFCKAIQVADEPTKILRVKEFRTKFNSLGLTDSDEKGWVQTIGATVKETGKNITDSLTWAVALRQKLKGPTLDTLRNAIEKLGTNASDWFDAFGVEANMLGALASIATILGTGNVAWLQSVPQASRSINPVKQCLEKLKAKFKNSEIRTLWTTFQALDFAVIWALAEQVPDPLHCAYLHINLIAPDIFWLTGITDSAKAKAVAEKVYSDATYQSKPRVVNAIATRLTGAIDRPWVKLFTCMQLADIHEKLTAACPLLTDLFFGTAGTIATTHTIVAETADFQNWISQHCDVVANLAHHGYPINAIMKMFDKGMDRRLMVSCTWFRRQPVTASLEFFFKVYVDSSNPSKGYIHGGLAANGMHLALRHLYENFDFTQIENRNSFHPRNTTAQDLVNLSSSLFLAHMNADSRQLVGVYYLVVTAHNNPSQRRVKSLYPNLLTTDPDYFTRAQVEAMRDVVALIPPHLPEL